MIQLTLKRGASEDIYLSTNELDAIKATFIVGRVGETPQFSAESEVIDGEAHIHITKLMTDIEPGVYQYQYNIEYRGGELEKYPDEGCDDEDGLPDFIITPSLDTQEGA